MKITHPTQDHPPAFGFTLKELVTAVALMTVIAGLVVPLLMWSNSFQETEHRRRAQLLAALSFKAQQAGVDFASSGELGPTLQNLMVGGLAPNGQRFQALGMSSDEVQAAAAHLRVRDGRLIYAPAGSVRAL